MGTGKRNGETEGRSEGNDTPRTAEGEGRDRLGGGLPLDSTGGSQWHK